MKELSLTTAVSAEIIDVSHPLIVRLKGQPIVAEPAGRVRNAAVAADYAFIHKISHIYSPLTVVNSTGKP